jgi:hypothetical protein
LGIAFLNPISTALGRRHLSSIRSASSIRWRRAASISPVGKGNLRFIVCADFSSRPDAPPSHLVIVVNELWLRRMLPRAAWLVVYVETGEKMGSGAVDLFQGVKPESCAVWREGEHRTRKTLSGISRSTILNRTTKYQAKPKCVV